MIVDESGGGKKECTGIERSGKERGNWGTEMSERKGEAQRVFGRNGDRAWNHEAFPSEPAIVFRSPTFKLVLHSLFLFGF